MTDIKALLREAAIVVRCYADREGEDCANAYADIELANQLEAAAESMSEPVAWRAVGPSYTVIVTDPERATDARWEPLYTTGTAVDSDQDSAQFIAYLEELLEQERDKLAAAEKDAARYRWLESHQEGWIWRPSRYNETIVSGFSANGTGYLGFGFTAAIDAARGEYDA